MSFRPSPTVLRTLKAVAPATSLLLAGINFASSHLTIPIIKRERTALGISSWSDLYHRGLVIVVPLAITSTVSSVVLAYAFPTQRLIWGLAAGSTISQLVWTGAVIWGTNNKLMALGEKQGDLVATEKTALNDLLTGWQWMNHVRGGLAFTGGVLALIATV